MYLSRLTPNLRNQKVRRDLRNAYDLHRTLGRSIESYGDDRILWRQEQGDKRTVPPIILVQTRHIPDWSYLEEKVPPSYLLEPAQIKKMDIGFQKGQILSFRLKANPTAIETDATGKKRRKAIVDATKQEEWLGRKLTNAGARPLRARLVTDAWLKPSKGEDKAKIALYSATFEGEIQVLEPETLLETVNKGIGSAKGFGMGLFSLAPDN